LRFFALYIAGRYIRSKKSQNAINVMSIIATAGVFVGAAALVIVLSVFNGFESLVTNLYNSFDADYVISPTTGKTFTPDCLQLQQLSQMPEVSIVSQVLEENVLLKNGDKQYFATIKGVSPQLEKMERLQHLIVDGQLKLESGGLPYACLGQGVAIGLSLSSSNSLYPLTVYIPNRLSLPDLINSANAFKILNINVSSVFSVQQDVDSKYVLVPISFARELLSYEKEVSAIEIYLQPNVSNSNFQKTLQNKFGQKFQIKNKEQQHELLYKIMKSEKWAVFFILVFILIVASFNVIGSLTMLIIDKKKDIAILKSMGASMQSIKNIFLLQGMLISAYGAIGGIITGLIICFIQEKFGVIGLGTGGSFVIDAYPVKIIWLDMVYVLITVLIIGLLASLIASRNIAKIEEAGLAATIKQE
jgi:lipoprotein-releasing system permease protein